MNENLNLVKILKDCPEGTKLYSPVYGDVELVEVIQVENIIHPIELNQNEDILYPIQVELYPIKIKLNNNSLDNFTKDGRIFSDYSGECMLFPSKDQRDWSKLKPKKPKFDPNTLKPFDKVVVSNEDSKWKCGLFSHIIDSASKYKYSCIGSAYVYCIPYNDDTKHLVGTADEAPEFYRYWED